MFLRKATVMYKILTVIAVFMGICTSAGAMGHGAEGSVVIEAESRRVLFEDNMDKRLPIASTTKIMTAVVALENMEKNSVITVSEHAQNQEGSCIYLRAGNQVTLENLLYGLMLNSGNDAAMAIAEAVAGDADRFAEMMNEKAADLGCKNTHFTNPSGLPDREHYSSAYDMALIMAYAMEKEDFERIVGTKEYQIELPQSVTYLRNHNKLLWQYNGCIGGKTGFTKVAGRCLVSCTQREGVRLITVTLNDPSDWIDHKNLTDNAFEKVSREKIISKNDIICTRSIKGARVNILAKEDIYATLYKGRKKGLVCRVEIEPELVGFGEKIGYARIYNGDCKIAETELICGAMTQEKSTFSHELRRILKGALLLK